MVNDPYKLADARRARRNANRLRVAARGGYVNTSRVLLAGGSIGNK